MKGFLFLTLAVSMLAFGGCSKSSPTGTPVEFSNACKAENNDKVIQVTGYLQEPKSTWCRNFGDETKCGMKLLDKPGSDRSISIDIIQGGAANEIEELPRDFKAEDVKIRDAAGNVINLKDALKVSGSMLVSPENNVCSMTVTKIEK